MSVDDAGDTNEQAASPEKRTAAGWQQVADLHIPTPVLSLLSHSDGLLAGGAGGIARHDGDGGWRPIAVPVSLVAALTEVGQPGGLAAGGADGIAWSSDGGREWRRADVAGLSAPVSALAAAGDTALAATLGGGVLRSDNSGRRWRPSNFGLASYDVNAICWVSGETVVAGTESGIHLSPNGGRAWRQVASTQDVAIVALAPLPAGGCAAVCADGQVLVAVEDLRDWRPVSPLPPGSQPTVIQPTGNVSLVVGTNTGMLRSDNHGQTWREVYQGNVLCLTASDGLVAGSDSGLVESADDGLTWAHLTAPPVHDVSRLVPGGDLFAYGPMTGLVRCDSGELLTAAVPITAAAAEPGGGLVASSPSGLARSDDGGRSWTTVVDGEAGLVHAIAFGDDGAGWAASSDGIRLLHTADGGVTWTTERPAWGAGVVLALSVVAGAVLVATHDPSIGAADLWRRSTSGGEWRQAARIPSAAPAIAMCSQPPVAALGSEWLYQRDGAWKRGPGPAGTARLLAGRGDRLIAVTDRVVAISGDRGSSWHALPGRSPHDIHDVALADDAEFILGTGGEVWTRSLSTAPVASVRANY